MLATFYLAAQIICIAGSARADEQPTSPPGSAICRAFANLLDDAFYRAGQQPEFSIDTTEKALQYMVVANGGEFTVVEPASGFAFMPADLDRVRAVAATLGHVFSPRRWEAEPGDTVRMYSADLDHDYGPDLAIERRKSGASCSDFEFWRSDEATGLLSRMPSPEGWGSCSTLGPSEEDIRFLAHLYGEVVIPMLAVGKGLEANFYLYRLKQTLRSTSKPASRKTSANSDLGSFRVPAICRVRLERQVNIASQGAEFCSRFGELVRSAVFDRSYTMGDPVEALLTVIRSRSPSLDLTWQAVVKDGSRDDVRSAMAGLGLGTEEADRLIAQFALGAPTVWISQGQVEVNAVMALLQGVASSGQVLTLLVRSAGDGVRVTRLPLVWLTSDSSQEQSWPLVYEERDFLLQTWVRSPLNLELALTPLDAAEPRNEGCRLTLDDHGMVAAIQYEPHDRP